MTDEMEAVLARVLADVTTADVEPPRVEHSTWQDGVPARSRMLRAGDGSGVGIWIALDQSEQEQLAHLADQVQDWVVEELARTRRPTNWPPCDTHPTTHPLQAGLTSMGSAAWTCPRGGADLRPVGSLSRRRRHGAHPGPMRIRMFVDDMTGIGLWPDLGWDHEGSPYAWVFSDSEGELEVLPIPDDLRRCVRAWVDEYTRWTGEGAPLDHVEHDRRGHRLSREVQDAVGADFTIDYGFHTAEVRREVRAARARGRS